MNEEVGHLTLASIGSAAEEEVVSRLNQVFHHDLQKIFPFQDDTTKNSYIREILEGAPSLEFDDEEPPRETNFAENDGQTMTEICCPAYSENVDIVATNDGPKKKQFEGKEYVDDLYASAGKEMVATNYFSSIPSSNEVSADSELNQAITTLARKVARSTKLLRSQEECEKFLEAYGITIESLRVEIGVL